MPLCAANWGSDPGSGSDSNFNPGNTRNGRSDDSEEEREVELEAPRQAVDGRQTPVAELAIVSQATFNRYLRGQFHGTWEDFMAALPAEKKVAKHRKDRQPRNPPQQEGESSDPDWIEIAAILASFGFFLIMTCLLIYIQTTSKWSGLLITVSYGAFLWLGISSALPRIRKSLWPYLPFIVSIFCLELDQQLSNHSICDEHWQWHFLLAGVLPHFLCALWFLRTVAEDPKRAALATNLHFGVVSLVVIAYSLRPESYIDKASFNFSLPFWNFCNRAAIVVSMLFIALAVGLFWYPSRWGPPSLAACMLDISCFTVWAASGGMIISSSLGWQEQIAVSFVFIAMCGVGAHLGLASAKYYAVLGLGQILISHIWEAVLTGGWIWGLAWSGALVALPILASFPEQYCEFEKRQRQHQHQHQHRLLCTTP